VGEGEYLKLDRCKSRMYDRGIEAASDADLDVSAKEKGSVRKDVAKPYIERPALKRCGFLRYMRARKNHT
jgi:hypothetical protein